MTSRETLPFEPWMKKLAREQSKGHIQAAFIEELLTKRTCYSKLVDIPGYHIDGRKPQSRVYGDSDLSQNSWKNLAKRLVAVGFTVLELKEPGTVQLLFQGNHTYNYVANEKDKPVKITPKVPNPFARAIGTLKEAVDADKKALAYANARRTDTEREYKRQMERHDEFVATKQQNYDQVSAALDALTKLGLEQTGDA